MSQNIVENKDQITAIDTHIHPIRGIATGESLIKEMDKSGVSQAILLALDLDPEVITNDNKLREEIIDDFYAYSYFINPDQLLDAMKNILSAGQTSNELVSQLCRKFPDRFLGFGSVNPSKSKKYVKEKLEEIESLGLHGIKLISTLQFFFPEKNKNLSRIFKFAQKRDWPILLHSGRDPGPFEIPTLRHVKASHPKYWAKHLNKFKTKVIFAHLGGYGEVGLGNNGWLDSVLELAIENPNVYLDTSAVTYVFNDPKIVNKLRDLGFERILFGSDTPVVHGTSMGHSKNVIAKTDLLSEKEKRMILRENAIRLFPQFNTKR
ncbi:MAG: amidohydrolase family protein [Candidatus Hodarchaeales archaeon]|jgi:predicted TIM-barrel fold metal-dependent hydrolase